MTGLASMLHRVALLLVSMQMVDSIALAATTRRPNFLILYADDLGYGDLSCYNADSKIATPHLDRLAREGMRFTDAHASASICSPSRYALLTGRYHWRRLQHIVGAFGPSAIEADRLTLPEALRSKGYATACIGKWHLGWNWESIKRTGAQPKMVDLAGKSHEVWTHDAFDWSRPILDGPLDHGFDYYFGDDVINFPPYAWIENNRCVEPPNADLAIRRETKEGDWETRPGPARSDWEFYANLPTLTAKAADWIASRRGNDEPFFLYLPLPSPHAPIVPSDAFDKKSQAGAYGDFVIQTDWSCGRVLQSLEESGHAQNTLVVFTSDNGPETYAYARDERWGHWSSGPLRGAKRDVYEGGHRVPFLVRWPSGVAGGSTSEALVSQVDLMATFAELADCDLPVEAAEDSFSLVPVLQGKPGGRSFLVHASMSGKFAMRKDDWVLIDAPHGYENRRDVRWETRRGVQGGEHAQGQLFHLADDLGQSTNLIDQHPERAAELRSRLARVRSEKATRVQAKSASPPGS